MLRRLIVTLALAGCALPAGSPTAANPADPAAPPPGVCVAAGAWTAGDGRPVAADTVLRRAAAAPAVLLGESHDEPEHHRWQLHTLAGIHAINPAIAIGLEMLPRSRQAALDRWTEGRSTEAELLRDSGWDEVWGFDAAMYLPVFHFARMHRIPMVALNVERALVARTGREGWAAVPESAREGVGDPAPPPDAYLDRLAAVMAQHGGDRGGGRDSPGFARFVEAQSVWDRAMAERIAATRVATGRTVVALMGSGHVEDRFGVPHQLAALGIPDAVVLLPWTATRDCARLDGRIADAVFGLAPPAAAAEPPRPRLGVMLEPSDGGVRIGTVSRGSVAAAAGLAAGDLVVAAAGTPVATPAELSAIVQRQAPGTWLPITVRRDRERRELVAKFPAR